MRNHIVIVSEESVHAGYYKCGIGEVVDYMSRALREFYDVTVITVGTRAGGKLGGTITCGVKGEAFLQRAAEHINMICPDLVHNFASPALIELLTVNCPKVLTFDRWEEDVSAYLEHVPKYDHVTTVSKGYADELLAEHPEAAEWPLKGILVAIDDGIYIPGGPFAKNKTKAECRETVFHNLKIEDSGKPLFVVTGRLGTVKGTPELIAAAPAIAAMGAELLVGGIGDPELEEQLQALHDNGTLIYAHRMPDYCEMCHAITAADFYLTPSIHEACGLQPMKAARMGTVPMVRPVGGMGENFDTTTAILITDGIEDAVRRAMALTDEEYAAMREVDMAGAWTWKTRILPWVEMYGLETAPPSESGMRRIGFGADATTGESSATKTRATQPVSKPRVVSPFATIEEDDDNE